MAFDLFTLEDIKVIGGRVCLCWREIIFNTLIGVTRRWGNKVRE